MSVFVFICRVLKPVIEFVMSIPEEHAEITPISSFIEELPCRCRSQHATPATPRSTQSDGRFVYFTLVNENVFSN